MKYLHLLLIAHLIQKYFQWLLWILDLCWNCYLFVIYRYYLHIRENLLYHLFYFFQCRNIHYPLKFQKNFQLFYYQEKYQLKNRYYWNIYLLYKYIFLLLIYYVWWKWNLIKNLIWLEMMKYLIKHKNNKNHQKLIFPFCFHIFGLFDFVWRYWLYFNTVFFIILSRNLSEHSLDIKMDIFASILSWYRVLGCSASIAFFTRFASASEELKVAFCFPAVYPFR